jgi:hypothetical protein
MRPIGFSTGALAYGDFRRGLDILRDKGAVAVELSALREHELEPLVGALDALDLTSFAYVSFHAPSKYEEQHEAVVIELLKNVAARGWRIILHPDAVFDFSAWEPVAHSLLIENMDKRNTMGRTASELALIFDRLPQAGLCFDIGHCRQVDPTMNESNLILREFQGRLTQLHMSEVNSRSTHDAMSGASISAFEKVAFLIPENVPVILESPVQDVEVLHEIENARLALPIRSATYEEHPAGWQRAIA